MIFELSICETTLKTIDSFVKQFKSRFKCFLSQILQQKTESWVQKCFKIEIKRKNLIHD